MFNIRNVVELHETFSYLEANSYLKQGWTLITCYKRAELFKATKDVVSDESLVYVLGRTKNIPKYKKDEPNQEIDEKLAKILNLE